MKPPRLVLIAMILAVVGCGASAIQAPSPAGSRTLEVAPAHRDAMSDSPGDADATATILQH